MSRTIDESRQTAPVADAATFAPDHARSRREDALAVLDAARQSPKLPKLSWGEWADDAGVSRQRVCQAAAAECGFAFDWIWHGPARVREAVGHALLSSVVSHGGVEPIVALFRVVAAVGVVSKEAGDALVDGKLDESEGERLLVAANGVMTAVYRFQAAVRARRRPADGHALTITK